MIGRQGPVGLFAGETLGAIVVGAGLAPPDTDLSVLPTVPPVEPAWANAGMLDISDATRPKAATIAKKLDVLPIFFFHQSHLQETHSQIISVKPPQNPLQISRSPWR